MLRLWPETVDICLFPGVAWRVKKGAKPTPLLCEPTPDAAVLLEQLLSLLDAQDPPLRPGSRVELTVSDTVANVVAMPWQRNIRGTAEIDAYAHACFQHAGLTVDSGWAVHAEFRDLDAFGLAYAIPNVWLESLLAALAQRTLVLSSVLPLSARMYFAGKPRQGAWPCVMFGRERQRHIACVFGPAGLIGYDVEAIVGGVDQSAQRLEGRVAAQHGNILRHAIWQAAADDAARLGQQPWQPAP